MKTLSAIFGAGVAARNRLYDNGALRQQRLRHPVISVGNLSVGGAGKTPFVIMLGELLQQHKFAFDVLSRGYGRDDKAVRLVDAEGKATTFGDEPMLIARALQVPVIVGADRVAAGQHAEELFKEAKPAHGRWLHLVDDGFQHRRLARDIDIVLISAADLDDSLLPAGRLREPLRALERAQIIVITDDTPERSLPASAHGKHIWRARREVVLPALAPLDSVPFCGIARPERFFADLAELGVSGKTRQIFPDHHRYTQTDVGLLLGLRKLAGATSFITTVKDIVNLEAAELLPALAPVFELQLRMKLWSPSAEEAIEILTDALARAS